MHSIKKILKENKALIFMVMFFRRVFRNNIIKKKRRNTIRVEGLMKSARMVVVGVDNEILIKKPRTNIGLNLSINGNGNRVRIEGNCVLKDLHIWIEDDNNEIYIGQNTLICGKTKLSCIEGRKIIIGQNCMFSSEIDFRTGDSHSILDMEGKRINPSANIVIGNHVWVGYGVTVLKGVSIAKDSIIGTRAVVTKSFYEEGSAIAGTPAKIVKKGINWDMARLPMGES